MGAMIYAIAVLDKPAADLSKKRGTRELQAISSDTGGRAYFVATNGELDQALKDIKLEIENTWVVTYPTPKGADPKNPRRIEITPQHSDLQITAPASVR